MPQPDIETPVRHIGSGGDGRVTCETLFKESTTTTTTTSPDLNFPPDSYYISTDDQHDWFGRNIFFERNESHKGIPTTNPNSHSRSVPNNSQRSSGNSKKSKPSIIGLPRPQTNTFHDCKIRRHLKSGNIRFFPKRIGSAAKFSLRMNEPSSPKVSCMGKVRSNPCRRSREKSTAPEKTGFWSSFNKFFSFGCRNNHAVNVDKPLENQKKVKEDCERGSVDGGEGQVNPPGLGGMNRFVSGRRSNLWAADVELCGSPNVV